MRARSTPINRHVWTVANYFEKSEDMIGLCTHCRAERENTEPDATQYPCADCGLMTVYGLEYLLIAGLLTFKDEEE